MPLRWKSEQSEKALTTRDVNKENTKKKEKKKEKRKLSSLTGPRMELIPVSISVLRLQVVINCHLSERRLDIGGDPGQ